MHLHAEAFGHFAERHNLPPLTKADRARLDGRRNSEIFPILFNREVSREEWLVYEHEKEGLNAYYALLELAQGKSVLLEEYARDQIAAEEMHLADIRKMMRKPGSIK